MARHQQRSANLPIDVESVRQVLSRDPSHELSEVAAKLIKKTPDLAAMWETLRELDAGKDDWSQYWVWCFLRSAALAINLPRYYYLSGESKRALAGRIASLGKKLSQALIVNNLDVSLIYSDGKNFNGFLIFEDFGEANQGRIDAAGTQKLRVSKLIRDVAERSTRQILDEAPAGKAGKNVQAIRFARLIAAQNMRLYREPLNVVTATATNALFGTNYEAKDIQMLQRRQPSKRKSLPRK